MKILATIGPKSCSENSIKKISKYTKLFRINGSHNTLDWHVKISKKLKIFVQNLSSYLIFLGLNPEQIITKVIHIKKDQTVTFSFGNIKVDDGILINKNDQTSSQD